MDKKPLILITHSKKMSLTMQCCFKLAILLAGGKPHFISAEDKIKHPAFDGLILSGGIDVDPHLYQHERKPNYPYDFERDQLEITLLKRAEEEQKPVLGICRGAQLINVARDGTLYFDIFKAYEKLHYPHHLWGYIFFRKQMTIETDSLLYKIFKTNLTTVNSLHSQAVHILGKDLIITAKDGRDIVQGIEKPTSPFYVGVQFHPEFLIYRKEMRRLFTVFVESCDKTRIP